MGQHSLFKFEFNFEKQPIIQLGSNDDFNKTRFQIKCVR
jgi:hypothetical protein